MRAAAGLSALLCLCGAASAQDWWKPYSPPCTERENVFEFTQKPAVKLVGKDKYEIKFAVKGYCDVAAGIIDRKGKVLRHLGSGVLGENAPAPFQKGSLKQTLLWDGKDDLDVYADRPETLRVKVSLGLKPTFDKILGWSPYDPGGRYLAIAADAHGVLALVDGNHYPRPQLRRYDRDGNYVKTVFPPAADLPLDEMKGMEALEYEPGKKTIHSLTGAEFTKTALSRAPPHNSTVSGYGAYFPPAGAPGPQQACIANGWFIYANTGNRVSPVWLHRMRAADGASDDVDYAWLRLTRATSRASYFVEFTTSILRICASPDGKWVYVSGLNQASGRNRVAGVYRLDATKRDPMGAKPFIGFEKEPGNDNAHLNHPEGIACDAQGRIYVCDSLNNRIQVFSPEGQYVRTLKVSGPQLIHIDRDKGIPYVVHSRSIRGMSAWQLSKLKSLTDAQIVAGFNITAAVASTRASRGGRDVDPLARKMRSVSTPLFVLDVTGKRPRAWLVPARDRLIIVEEAGEGFRIIRDFDKDVRKDGLRTGIMLARFPKVTADASREQLYYYGPASSSKRQARRYDLKTGKLTPVNFSYGYGDFGPDIAFSKSGYMYTHITGMVMRHDPERTYRKRMPGGPDPILMKEVPLDHGTVGGSLGAVATKDQGCAKGYQDGFGVNMRGDFVVESNIAYVPRMQDEAKALIGGGVGASENYAAFLRRLDEQIKRGEDLYSIPRQPGIRPAGGTLWVYDRSGEVRHANMVRGLGRINGAQIDQDGGVYFVMGEKKVVAGLPFLSGRGTHLGSPDRPANEPFTGCLVKVSRPGAKIIKKNVPVKPDPPPKRPVDVAGSNKMAGPGSGKFDMQKRSGWVEGVDWIYAGASPIVPSGCSCPNMRIHTDWFKRTYVPEMYRHSIGIVDTAGNLIMHLGRYGNADSGRGPDSPVKVGGDEIAMSHVQYLSGTDNYLCLSDAGNARIVVLKLDYHADETVPIKIPARVGPE